jgi:hypothetical protein
LRAKTGFVKVRIMGGVTMRCDPLKVLKTAVLLGILCGSLSACFGPIAEKVGGKVGGEVGTIAVTGDRKMVIVRPGLWEAGKFCSEPAPYVDESVAAKIVTMLEADRVGVRGATALANSVQELFRRSQGVQLYRDGMYALCQAAVNNTLTPEEFKKQSDELLKQAAKLVEKELEVTKGLIGPPPRRWRAVRPRAVAGAPTFAAGQLQVGTQSP